MSLAELRLDGFVLIDAGKGVLTTKPSRMSVERIVVNADARDALVAEEILELGQISKEVFRPKDAGPACGIS